MELNASPINVTLRRLAAELFTHPGKPCPGKLKRLGVAIESDQAPRRPKQLCNLRCVSGQAQRAVHHRCACAHMEKLNRFF